MMCLGTLRILHAYTLRDFNYRKSFNFFFRKIKCSSINEERKFNYFPEESPALVDVSSINMLDARDVIISFPSPTSNCEYLNFMFMSVV